MPCLYAHEMKLNTQTRTHTHTHAHQHVAHFYRQNELGDFDVFQFAVRHDFTSLHTLLVDSATQRVEWKGDSRNAAECLCSFESRRMNGSSECRSIDSAMRHGARSHQDIRQKYEHYQISIHAAYVHLF